MASELSVQTPVNINFAFTLVNRAWRTIQRKFIWSFLWGDAAIPTINPVVSGTVTTTLGSNQVTGNAAAVAAWNLIPATTPIGTLQFRVGTGTFYNITAYDPVAGVLTLDKLFVDPGAGANTGYSLQSVYFNAPTQDFLWWEEKTFKDPNLGYSLNTLHTRGYVDAQDPQRISLGIPAAVIPFQINPTPGAFFQFPMYEMWPAPAGLTYVGQYWRSGSDFVLVTDTVPSPLGEDIVLAQAKIECYEWCEANKDKLMPAQRAGDFRYLIGKNQKEVEGLLNDYILKDETFSRRHVITAQEIRNNLTLPWVSQAQAKAFFPG